MQFLFLEKGLNLKSIIRHSVKKKTFYKVKVVISNNQKAKGLIIAKKNKIKNYNIDFTKSKKLGKESIRYTKKK